MYLQERLHQALKALILTTLIVIPLLFSYHFWLSFEYPKTRGLIILVLLATIILLIILWQNRERSKLDKQLLLSRRSYLILIYMFALYITSLLGANWNQSLLGSPWRLQGLLVITAYILVYFLSSYLFQQNLQPLLVSKTIMLTAALETVYSLWLLYRHYVLLDPSVLLFNGRLTGTFSNPNLLAVFLVITLPFQWYVMQHLQPKWKLLSVLLLVLQTLVIFSTFSRSGLILWGLCFVYLLLERISLLSKPIKFLITGGIICSIIYFFIQNPSLPFLRPSMYEQRGLMWQTAFQAVLKRPIIGYGIENINSALSTVYQDHNHPLASQYIDRTHNEFLDLLLQSGLVGLTIFILILITIMKQTKSYLNTCSSENREWIKTLMVAFISLLIFCQVNFVLTTGYIYWWFILGALDGYLIAQNRNFHSG